MEDGFYLSTYLHIDEISHIMKFHIRHDENITLWEKDGNHIRLVHVWELERVSGLKKCNRSFYDLEQTKNYINNLLTEYELTLDDMKEVIGTPQLDTCNNYHSLKEYPDISYHSIAHLFSSMLMDTDIFRKENILALAVDGGPDTVVDEEVASKSFYCSAISKQGEVEIRDACSPGFLWTYLRKKSGMQEGSLMALATACNCELIAEEQEMVKIYENKDLKNAYGYIESLFKKVENLKEPDQETMFRGYDDRFTLEENKISMIVKKVQEMSLRIIDYNINQLIQNSALDPKDCYIAISGGYGLNCPTNSYLMKKYHFKGFLALPCINDAGISIGMGLYYFYKNLPDLEFHFETSYYGNKSDYLEEILDSEEFRIYVKEVSEFDENQAVKDLSTDILIWFDGRSEIGPRALGHRSILGDPRKIKTRDRLNFVKQREWWRPVAPIVIYEQMEQWFDESYYSPYMLHTLTIKKECENLVPAIRHLDGSARVQTIKSADNPCLYRFLSKFYEQEGIPIVCNTSLNDKGEPIIDSIQECLNFALRKDIKIVYLNQKRIVLQNHNQYLEKKPYERPYQLDFLSGDEKEEELRKLNPHGIERDILIFFYERPSLKKKLDITKKSDVSKLRLFEKLAKQKQGEIPTPGL